MNSKYLELFTLITQQIANLAEQVMNDHQDKGETKEQETAQTMRDDYLNLHDKLISNQELNKADYARILVGAIIIANQLTARIQNEQKALDGYKLDIIPKLDQINNTEYDEVPTLAEKLFTIKEESNEEDN